MFDPKEEVYSNNRIKLSDTIYEIGQQGSFTIDELADSYLSQFEKDDIKSIGGGWSIRDYLEHFRTIEVLKDHGGGHYSLRSK